MAGFSELIKNFEKIRDYTREFFVYGYKCRSDYNKKSGRSYDNERRRIESFLSGYIKWETSSRGKRLFISADTADLSHNPLLALWETKSFTKNDCMLHFYLPDILRENPGANVQEVAWIIGEKYLGCFDACNMPDVMTIRNKLSEYAAAGLFGSEKDGKTLRYFLLPDLFEQVSSYAKDGLFTAVRFFENTAPAGFLGYFIRRDHGKGVDMFSFRHMFLAQTLDDEILIRISDAIAGKMQIRFQNYSNRAKTSSSETVLPLKIAVNVRHGRRFLLAYNLRLRKFFSYRLDYIKHVEVLSACDSYAARLTELEDRLPFSWGVASGKKTRLEWIEVTLYIDESIEDYVLARLRREGKKGTIEKVADNTFVYRNEIFDTMEMLPWLRTFIGRILFIQGSNKPVIRQFINDVYRMAEMYED